jgi:hypothetical protein
VKTYVIELSLRVSGTRQLKSMSTAISTDLDGAIDNFVEVYSLGNVIAQSKGHVKGRICFDHGVIDYNEK